MNPNRRFAELAGIHICSVDPILLRCKCGTKGQIDIPDFTDAREVLKVMDKKPNCKLFYAKLIYDGDNVKAIDDDGLIPRHYITDQTGILRDLAIEWMEERK